MPILAEETALFPEDLLDAWEPGSSERTWWAIYTKARQEKSLARHLLRYQVPFYLPMVAKTLLKRGRRVRSHVPLFAGYVFLYGSVDERRLALTTNRISQVLVVADPARLHRDLQQVRRLIESGAPLTVESRLQPGQRVRIRAGALEGVEGEVISRSRKCRMVVAVDFLQKGVSMEIEDVMLEPLG